MTSGFSEERLEQAYRLLDEAARAGHIPAATLAVSRGGEMLPPRAFGRQYLQPDSPAAQPDTVYLVASITKPVTATAVMMLVERGYLTLDDPVAAIVPEFVTQGKGNIRLRHLLTHTSGLPDMLPTDRALRRAHAPLSEFVRLICDLSPDFEPGAAIQYQSMGFAMMGEIVARVTGSSLRDFLRRELFDPLGMADTSLGLDETRAGRIAHVNVPPDMIGQDWGWNTPYWWNLGAPWGGMFSTANDLLRFANLFLSGGLSPSGERLLGRATIAAMLRDQTTAMIDPALTRGQQAWGLGWRLVLGYGWAGYFGDLLTPGSFGHGGATGTVLWADPVRELACALLTTEPTASETRLLGRVSNIVAAAVV